MQEHRQWRLNAAAKHLAASALRRRRRSLFNIWRGERCRCDHGPAVGRRTRGCNVDGRIRVRRVEEQQFAQADLHCAVRCTSDRGGRCTITVSVLRCALHGGASGERGSSTTLQSRLRGETTFAVAEPTAEEIQRFLARAGTRVGHQQQPEISQPQARRSATNSSQRFRSHRHDVRPPTAARDFPSTGTASAPRAHRDFMAPGMVVTAKNGDFLGTRHLGGSCPASGDRRSTNNKG
jgi:hypothetical protein